MERLNVAFYLLLITLLFSCSKGAGEFKIEGIISDDTFQTPLVGAEVKIFKIPIGTNTEQFVASINTGSDGKYQFTVPRERMEKYIIRVTKNNYFPIEKTVFFSELTIKEINTFNLLTWAKSWVELKFVNTNPLPQDHLQFIKQDGYGSCMECCPITEQHLYGTVDTSIYCINKGNTLYSYLYWLINANVQGYMEANTTAFDTTQIILNY